MKYIFKHTIKNILSKPGRSLILIFCIMMTALTAMMALDMTESISGLLKAFMIDTVGTADMTAVFTNTPDFEGLENYKTMAVASLQLPKYTRDEELYWYSFRGFDVANSLNDYEYAAEQGILDKVIVLEDGEIAVNENYAEAYDIKIGDKVILKAPFSEEEREFTIKEIIVFNLPLYPKDRTAIFMNESDFCFLASLKEMQYSYYDIDVLNDKDINDFKEKLEANNPDCVVVGSEALEREDIQSIKGVFLLIFVLTLLLVFFITVSFSEKIVTERMSTVGTLRSLGVSDSKTAFFLLLENAVYAVIGAVIGCALYVIVKNAFIPAVLNLGFRGEVYDMKAHIPKTPFYAYLAAVGISLAVECVYPIKELIKASRTSIRDIIFDNKDTEYKYSWKRLYTGLILLIISVVSMFLVKSFVALSISLVTAVLASSILIPYLLKVLSKPVAKLFGKLKMPVAKLAASEVYNNKSMVSTAVLSVTSLVVTSCLFVFAKEMATTISAPVYDCDVIVTAPNDDVFTYSFIDDMEGVSDVEFDFYNYADSEINGVELKYVTYLEYEHKDLVCAYQGFEGTLSEDEIVITSSLARTCGISKGDSVEVTIGTDWFKPRTKTFTVKEIISVEGLNMSSSTIFMNKDLLFTYFYESIQNILIKCDDPAKTCAELKKYIVEDDYTLVQTYEEWNEMSTADTSIEMILFALIALAVGITLIGASGNQAIGFINRRRELAVLYSTSMPRAKLNRLLWLENAMSVGISCIVAMIVSPILISLLAKIAYMLTDGDLEMVGLDIPGVMIFIICFFFVMSLAVVKPIRFLKKMNVAEQLKYE
ncbi:MAG: FtsX-like permease family protein [Saccharofermentans sp.]|nr:FtsX-like permease family protein [Saccharofermentans sp.]